MKESVLAGRWEEDVPDTNTNFRSLALVLCVLAIAGVLLWQTSAASGNPNPLASDASRPASILDIAVLVFREGLECVLVLAAITAGTTEKRQSYQRSVGTGVGIGFLAALLTWTVAVRILTDLSQSLSALALQAATGLLAVIVLLVVMNWFFHRIYWTGWISLHNKRKRDLIEATGSEHPSSRLGFLWGMGILGFTSFYREGFEVVLFLQSYRLRLGNEVVLYGVCIGILLSASVAVLTFVAHRRLPYRKMLVLTGILLGFVLVVMVGEQAQEMQLAHWIPTTNLAFLAGRIPGWMGLWFSVFPTVETLLAQALAALLVLGSYFIANRRATAGQVSGKGQ